MGTVLSLILALSLVVRGSFLSSAPPELFGDEIDVGYQSLSLLKTGRDLYNQPFPTYLHSLSEWRAPLLMYFSVPSLALFGTSELGVRAPEVVLGTLGVALIFLLTWHTTRSRHVALLAALALALIPWHLHYSRVAFEVVLLLDLLLLGALLFLKQRYSLAALFFALTFYTYSTATVFTPLLLGVLLLVRRPTVKIVPVLLFILLLLPFAYHVFFGKARERFATVTIINHPKITEEATQIRSASPSPFERLFTNRPLLTARLAVTNYLSAFSTDFLFLRGDPIIRHNTNFTGQLLPVMALPLIIGLYHLFKTRKLIWILWLIIAPVPAALTFDGARHATRLFVMLPPLAVAVGLGLHQLLSIRKYILLGLAVSAVLVFQFAQFANYYVYRYATDSWQWWHVGFKSAFAEMTRLDPQYSRVFINNSYEPTLIRFLFYSGYPPAKFHQNFTSDQPQSDIYPNYYGFFLPPKYYFGGFSLPAHKSLPDILTADNLYLISQRDDAYGNWQTSPPGGVKVLFTSTNPYGDPILYLITRP